MVVEGRESIKTTAAHVKRGWQRDGDDAGAVLPERAIIFSPTGIQLKFTIKTCLLFERQAVKILSPLS